MANFRKRGKYWEYRISYTTNGIKQTISKSGFSTKAEAKIAATAIENDLNKGVKVSSANELFTAYYKRWIELYRIGTGAARTDLFRERSIKKCKLLFDGLRLKDIDKDTYQRIIKDFSVGYAYETIKKYNSHFKACFQHAVDNGILLINPAKNVVFDKNCGKSKKEEDKYISYYEVQKLITAIKQDFQPDFTSRYMILFALATGMRFGEILGLTWDCVNFTKQTITINKSWDYHITHTFTPTKTKQVRVISIDIQTIQLLKEIKTHQKVNSLNNQVFVDKLGNTISNNAVNKALKRACERAGIKPIHFHSLRHTHGSILLYKGASIFYISKRLGHANVSMTEEVYLHMIDELKQEEDKKLNIIFKELF